MLLLKERLARKHLTAARLMGLAPHVCKAIYEGKPIAIGYYSPAVRP